MENTWSYLVEYYNYHYPVIVFAVGASIVVGGYVFAAAFKLTAYWRGKMIRKARLEHIKIFLIDKFVSDVEDAFLNGDITREEAVEVYIDLKKSFPIPDLFPATEALKENIRTRMAGPLHLPVDLPDKKMKNMFEKS